VSQSIGGGAQAQTGEYADLSHIARVVIQHWLFIGAFVSLAVAIALFVAFSLTPLYKSSVTIILEPDRGSVSNVSALFDDSEYSFVHFETQRNLITSNEVLLKVVERLDLTNEPVFTPADKAPWWKPDWKNLLPFFDAPKIEPTDEEVIAYRRKFALSELGQAVTVVPVPFTELLRIEVLLADAALSAKVADELATVYVESGLEARFDKAKSANSWVADRVQELKQQLNNSEGLLQDYLETNKLTDVGGIRGLVEADIQENTSNLLAVKKNVAILKNVVSKINAANGRLERLQDIQRLVANQVVQDTRRDYQTAQQLQSKLATRYGPKHPKLIAAKVATEEARSVYHEQLKLEAENVLTEYQLAKQSVSDIQGFTAENKQQLSKLGRQSYELRALQRDVDLNRQMYDLFLAKMKETDISGRFDTVNARVIDPAQEPRRPTEPRKKKIVLLAFFISLVVAVGLVLLRYFLNNRVSTPEHFGEIIAPTPVLCSVPAHSRVNWKKGAEAAVSLTTKDRAFSEAMRTLRTNVQLCEVDRKNQVIMVASATPSEGKTTMSIGLATAFAQLGKVLLIETDLRKPTFAKRLSLDGERSNLVDHLLGNSELADSIHHVEALNLDVMAVGAVPPNPQEMLQSKKFTQLLESLRGQYDRIILDTAPVLAVADAQILVANTDGVILVSRADQTHKQNIAEAASQFRELAACNLIGGVINGIDTAKLSRYYGKQYKQYYEYYA
jgi:capsular exopolysaccharide synthesis family protein